MNETRRETMDQSVSVVGLGKLGLCLAACFAEKGFETVGVDIAEGVVDAVNAGRSPIVETGLDEMIARLGGKRLCATLDHRRAIERTDVTFVLTATPSMPDGSFSNRQVEAALASLAGAFGEVGKPYHLFVISSTVVPGSTEGRFIPLIERHSGRRAGEHFDVCYDPDFVALGDVVRGFLNPEIVVIGESRPEAGARVQALHEAMCENEPYISRMSIASAEIAKVSLNAYITMKISYANTLANICERVPGADVDRITETIGRDRRISPHFFRGGLSFGGTCFPRDTRAFITIAERCDVDAALIRAADRVNRAQDAHLLDTTLRHAARRGAEGVSVLGMAFKPDTPVIVESAGVKLVEGLLKEGIHPCVYDPLAMEEARRYFGDRVEYADSARACVGRSPVCVVTTRSAAFGAMDDTWIEHDPTTVIDGWRMLDPAALGDRVEYVALGRANASNGT
jgi:UDPglucose 6-dehydrogenase